MTERSQPRVGIERSQPRGGTERSPAGVEAAPAKINLALHVTGRRADGYHLLDTLVTHGGAADLVSAALAPAQAGDGAPRITLTITGRFGARLDAGPDNLVVRAARLLADAAMGAGARPGDVALSLDKQLPLASGIGGGSSDAAATLRLLNRLWRLELSRNDLARLALPLGADVPMCVWGATLRARGIGETIEILPALPELALVLVNPGVAVATPAVFRALATRDNPPLPALPDRFADLDALVGWLAATRNDLQAAALTVAPAIGAALAALAGQPGCRLARMSGSGATCFGLFADRTAADAAAMAIAAQRPGWWVA